MKINFPPEFLSSKNILEMKEREREIPDRLKSQSNIKVWHGEVSADHGGGHVANIEFGKAGEVEEITKMVKGIASWEFPMEKALAEYNPESLPFP